MVLFGTMVGKDMALVSRTSVTVVQTVFVRMEVSFLFVD